MRDDLNARARAAHRRARSGASSSSTTIRRARARTASRRIIRSSPELGRRALPLTRELWIERDDFTGARRRRATSGLRRAPRCGCATRYIVALRRRREGRRAATSPPSTAPTIRDTRSGTPGADARKVKGNIHWLSAAHARAGRSAPLRSAVRGAVSRARATRGAARGDAARRRSRRRAPRGRRRRRRRRRRRAVERNYLDDLNPDSQARDHARTSSRRSRSAAPEERFQFERHGYFVADLRDHAPGKPVFNRAVTLRDSWAQR